MYLLCRLFGMRFSNRFWSTTMKKWSKQLGVSCVLVSVGYLCSFWFGNHIGNPLGDIKIQASATDRSDNMLLATGYVDPDLEAVYYLNQTTGRLAAGILSKRDGKFQGLFDRNINADLAEVLRQKKLNIQVPIAPKYTMVTGEVDAENRGGIWKVAKSVVYIAEANTGMMMVYTIPWQPTLHGADQISQDVLQLWTAEQFQPALIRQ